MLVGVDLALAVALGVASAVAVAVAVASSSSSSFLNLLLVLLMIITVEGGLLAAAGAWPATQQNAVIPYRAFYGRFAGCHQDPKCCRQLRMYGVVYAVGCRV